MNQYIRIHLERLEDGEKLYICVPLFNENNGLINYPVDLTVWKVVKIERGSGVKDNQGREIYEGDIIEVECKFSLRKETLFQEVIYDNRGFFSTDEFALFHLVDSHKKKEVLFKVIGNTKDHSYLLE